MSFKKIGLISILVGITLGLTGCDEYNTGDLIHNGRFEIIEIINSEDSIYEVRDTKEGVHYFTDIYYDNFSPLMLPMSKARGFCKAIIEAPFLNYQNYHFLNFLFKSSIPLVFLKKLRKLSIGSCFYFRSTNHSVLIYQR